MSFDLMTGYAGEPHITSEKDGAVNAAIYGKGRYVLDIGQKFDYEIISNNLIKIKDGYAIDQGRKMGQAFGEYEELTIDNGIQGVKRTDIIAIQYNKNMDTGIETADLVVIKGVSGDAYIDPEFNSGDILCGEKEDVFPLYRVNIENLSIVSVEKMFEVFTGMSDDTITQEDIESICILEV